SSLGRMQTFDPIHASASHHLSVAIYDEVDHLLHIRVARPIRATRSKVHPKQTADDVGRIDRVPRTFSRTEQQLVTNRRAMPPQDLFLDILHVGNPQLGWRIELGISRNLEAHYYQAKGLCGRIGN